MVNSVLELYEGVQTISDLGLGISEIRLNTLIF